MKKTLLLFTLLAPFFVKGQDKDKDLIISMENKTSLQEKYSEKNEGETQHKIKLNIESKKDLDYPIDVYVKIEHVSTTDDDIKLITTSIPITASTLSKGNKSEAYIYLAISNDSTRHDSSDEVFKISLEFDTTNLKEKPEVQLPDPITVTILDGERVFDPINPFRISIGTNFDLENNIEANSFYGQVNFNKSDLKELMTIGNNKKLFFGVEAGLYKNRSVSKDSGKYVRQYFDNGIDTISGSSQFWQVTKERKDNISVSNLGIYFSPSFILREKKSITGNFFEMKTLLYSESLQRNIKSTYTYGTPDTVNVIDSTLTASSHSLPEYTQYKQNDYYLGGGFGLRYRDVKYGEINVRAIFGSGWYRREYSSGAVPKNLFYIFKFTILETNAGVELGGDIRGYFKQPDHYISIYLSKTFGLKHFLKFDSND